MSACEYKKLTKRNSSAEAAKCPTNTLVEVKAKGSAFTSTN